MILGREGGIKTMIFQIVHYGTSDRWVSRSRRRLAKISQGEDFDCRRDISVAR